jgi:hypothetical protein
VPWGGPWIRLLDEDPKPMVIDWTWDAKLPLPMPPIPKVTSYHLRELVIDGYLVVEFYADARQWPPEQSAEEIWRAISLGPPLTELRTAITLEAKLNLEHGFARSMPRWMTPIARDLLVAEWQFMLDEGVDPFGRACLVDPVDCVKYKH